MLDAKITEEYTAQQSPMQQEIIKKIKELIKKSVN